MLSSSGFPLSLCETHLHEVASARGTQARQQGTRALGSHHLPARHHTDKERAEVSSEEGDGMKDHPDAARQQAMYTRRAMNASARSGGDEYVRIREWW